MTPGLERWNQDEVYYRLLQVYKAMHLEPPSRTSVKDTLNKICKRFGITRESLNIIAGSRAVIYFEGKSYSVGYDVILTLAKMGVDVVCIEKDGVCEILTDHANKYGIALVNTRGHLTEYCERLMVEAEKSGALVVIITDYEYVGIKIASESPSNVHWIGVNDEMLEYFHLTKEELEIDAENDKSKAEVISLVNTGYGKEGSDDRFRNKVDLGFLASGKRIEINAVLAAVGSERFFEYIIYKLQQISPTRDYTRVIKMPSEYGGGLNALFPRPIKEVLLRINSLATDAIGKKENDITKRLQGFKGHTEVDKKREEIQTELTKVLEEDENIKKIVTTFKKLLKPGVLPNTNNLPEKELDSKYWETGELD